MAIYPIWNPETGERKIIEMSVNEIMDWYKQNQPWTRDWNEGCASSISETGFWQDKLHKKHPSWKQVLSNASKSAGSQSKIGKI